MKVQIELNDIDSFTREESIEKFKHLLGKSINIQVLPDSYDIKSILRFALQQMVGYEQLCLLNDDPYNYKSKIESLQSRILGEVNKELLAIIVANEIKYGE